jgi:hypothetical protein
MTDDPDQGQFTSNIGRSVSRDGVAKSQSVKGLLPDAAQESGCSFTIAFCV